MAMYANGMIDQINSPLSYSRNGAGVGDLMAPFLGTRTIGSLGGAERGRMTEIDDMPVAFEQRSKYLGSVVHGLSIIDQTYLTTYVLPIEVTKEINFQWNEFHFDQPLPTVVPHQGVPRIVQHGRQRKSAAAIRKGIAAHFENDFLTTPDGVDIYVRTMRQITLAIQRAIEVDVFAALLEANEDEMDWQAKHGYIRLDWLARMQREVDNYALFSKDPTGFEQWGTDVFATARANGWEPNMVIINQECKALYKFGHPERYLYFFAGPRGVQRWMDGPASLGTMMGLPVFEAPTPNAYSPSEFLPVVRAPITIGEWVPFVDRLRHTPQAKRHVRDRNQLIYNETGDCWTEIGFSTIVPFLHRFDEAGDLHPSHWEVAAVPDNMDIFIAKNTFQQSFVTQWWGQVETAYVDETTMKMSVHAAMEHLTEQQRAALNYVYSWFQRTRDAPVSRAFLALVGQGDAANETARGAAAAAPFGALPLGGGAAGTAGTLAANYAADTRMEWEKLNMAERAYYLGKVHATGPVLADCLVKKLQSAPGELASWVGLEIWAERDPRLAEGIEAARKLYHMCLDAYGGLGNPVLNPVNCPAHLRRFVRDENLGVCTFVERTVFSGVAPLVYRPLTGSNAAIAASLGNVNKAAAKTAFINIEKLRAEYDAEATLKKWDDMAKQMKTNAASADQVDFVSNMHNLIMAVAAAEIGNRSGDVAIDAVRAEVLRSHSYFIGMMAQFVANASVASVSEVVSNALTNIMTEVRKFPPASAFRALGDLLHDDNVQVLTELLMDDERRLEICTKISEFIGRVVLKLEQGNDQMKAYAAAIQHEFGLFPDPAAVVGAAAGPTAVGTPTLLPMVCRSIPSIAVSTAPMTYAKTLWVCDPRTGFSTDFNPGMPQGAGSPSDEHFRMLLNRVPSSRWAREGASVNASTMPDESEYSREGPRGWESVDAMNRDAADTRGGAAYLPMAQQRHDASRNTFARSELTGSVSMGDAHVDAFANSPAFKSRYDSALLKNTFLDLAVRFALCFTRITLKNMTMMAECDWCVKPWNVLMFMPRDTHEMGGALALRGGPDLGRTYVGHVNTKNGEDPVHTTVMFNITFYHRAVVKESRHVVRHDFLHYIRYIGGHNARPATTKDLLDWPTYDFGPPQNRDDWSLIFVLVPHTETFEDSKFIDLRGFAIGDDRRNYDNNTSRADPQYSTHAYYNNLFSWIHLPDQPYGLRLYTGNANRPNSLCVRGPWREFNSVSETFGASTVNQGHHGPIVQPGVGRVRNGLPKSLKEAVAPMGPAWIEAKA